MIYQCKDSDFLKNVSKIRSYIFAKRDSSIINNTERLIDLLGIYFSTLLYYNNYSTEKYRVKIRNKEYEIKLDGTNDSGEPMTLDLIEAEHSVINSVLSFILHSMNITDFEKLQNIYISILQTSTINLQDKVNILNSDNKVFNRVNDYFMYRIDESIALNSIVERINVLYSLFGDQDTFSKIENAEITYNIFDNYLKLYLRNCIYRNNFAEGLIFLQKELNRFKYLDEKIILDDNKISFCLLSNIISYNNLFQLLSKEKLESIIEDFEEFLDEKNSKIISNNLNFSPDSITLDTLNIGVADPDFSTYNLDNIITQISFIIHLNEKFTDFECNNDGNKILIKQINNLFDDPIFSFYNSIGIEISGMPLSIISDSVGSIHDSYLVEINIPYFYHPDFDIVDNIVVYKDFILEKAKHGGKYYPHKDFIIEQLFAINAQRNLPFQLKKKDINSNYISNYFVAYYYNNEQIQNQVFTITNFDSYFKTKNKYFENVNKLEFGEDTDLSDFILKTDIENNKQFLKFCTTLIDRTVKKSIELGGLYKNLWIKENNDLKPIKEVSAQTIIFNMMRYIAEMKGVCITRESTSANGSVDFLFQYTKNDKLLLVCVELKNAHHPKADEGNYKQLVEYIKDTGFKYGIYLILWYRCEDYQYPKRYLTISDLKQKLEDNYVSYYKIENMIIDCSLDKISPSRK